MFMHALVSLVTIVLAPETLTGVRLLTSILVSAAGMWLLVAIVAMANGWRLSARHRA
jgi:hypothetical protein